MTGVDGVVIGNFESKLNRLMEAYTQLSVENTALREQLAAKGVPAMVYYPIPLHLQKAYQDARYKAGDFPVAEKLAAEVLSLPMHTELDAEQLAYIVNCL